MCLRYLERSVPHYVVLRTFQTKVKKVRDWFSNIYGHAEGRLCWNLLVCLIRLVGIYDVWRVAQLFITVFVRKEIDDEY